MIILYLFLTGSGFVNFLEIKTRQSRGVKRIRE